MSLTRRTLFLAAIATAATPALADGDAPVLTVTGELTYLQRIALPEDAVVIVEIKPVDAADGESVTAEERIALRGRQVPVAFSISVERARLEAGKSYALRGAILVASQLRWLSDPVEIDVAADEIAVGTLRLHPHETPRSAGTADIFDTELRVTQIGDRQLRRGPWPTITLGADGSFHGKACNTFRGTYEIDGQKLSFGRAAATMMACDDPMAGLEAALFPALERVTQFSVMRDGSLWLMDAAANLVIEARP